MSHDCCGLSDINYFETYNNIELFLALMGTGATRSVYMLTAHEQRSNKLLFDLRIEANLDALLMRGRRAGTSVDAQMAAIAFDYAHRIIDAGVNGHTVHYRIEVGTDSEVLVPLIA